jgi:hypothetical protein
MLEFKLVRTLWGKDGFPHDKDPRINLPDDRQIFVPGLADPEARGLAVYVRFLDSDRGGIEVTDGPSVDFTMWFKDRGSDRWISGHRQGAAVGSKIFPTSIVGDLFVQVTDVRNPGNTKRVEIWVSELTVSPCC